MIYLDRVDKGMESLIQKHNLVWIKLFTSEETFSNNISVDFSGKFKIKFGKSKEWKFSAQKENKKINICFPIPGFAIL